MSFFFSVSHLSMFEGFLLSQSQTGIVQLPILDAELAPDLINVEMDCNLLDKSCVQPQDTHKQKD